MAQTKNLTAVGLGCAHLYPKPSGSLELGLWSLSCIGGDTGFKPKTRGSKELVLKKVHPEKPEKTYKPSGFPKTCV